MSNTKRKTERVTGNANPVIEDTLAALRRLVPSAFAENKLDFDKLRAALGDTVETRPERYSFSWAGKSDAIRLLQMPTRASLTPCPHEGINPDATDNIFIEGDNLEVLKLLYKPYFGRVKMIYIDPPYNTGKDFVYPDNFADPLDTYLKMTGQKDSDGNLLTSNPETGGRYHSAWLSMMYPRLFLARQLLRDDGVIFISIDDHEVHDLRIVMNEIFGEENFVASMPWKGRGGRQDSSFIAEIHEYMVVFAKNIGAFEAGEMPKEGEKFPKWDSEKEKHYKTQLLRKWGSNSRRSDRPKLFYPILAPDGAEVLPKLPNGEDGCWRWDKKRMQREMESGNVEFVIDNEAWTGYEKIYAPEEGEIRTKKFTTWLDDVGNAATGTDELKDLFGGESPFSFPKPVTLLKRLLNIGNAKGNHVILDFFAGACTTAHAVMELNKQDSGNRRFICVQLPEPTQNKDYPTIADIGKERIRRAIKKLTEPAADGDLTPEQVAAASANFGFKVFKLMPSNFKPWTGVAEDDPASYARQMELYLDPLIEHWQPIDVIWETAIKEGFGLNARIEPLPQVQKNTVYRVIEPDKNQSFCICLDPRIDAGTPRSLALGKDDLFICRDIALDDELAANLALQCRLKTI